MTVAELVKPHNVVCNVSVRSKKHCLEVLSDVLATSSPEVAREDIFARLFERERLGSTGLGHGVAFPHCRFEGIAASNAALLKLSEPVEFDSPDDQSVDLVFGLMVPEEITDRHRKVIAEITRLLEDERIRRRLREASNSNEMREAVLAGFRREGSRVAKRKSSSKG
jgi:nitrogen PTS system EIIA component